MELVASEPVIRQPVDLHFDDRGRLWVVQYLQYPFPAGLTITPYDQYLRARYNAVPAAPPNHVRGADKITVLEDKDGDGVVRLAQGRHHRPEHHHERADRPRWRLGDESAVSALLSRLRPATGSPTAIPKCGCAGFGLEDTHSLANSLTWGPDGWLYGVHGSTSTARVRGISFLGQAVWRYHPDTDAFELFAQGGGNPWTLSFDSRGARSRVTTAATAAAFTGCRADATKRTGRSTARSTGRTRTASSRTWTMRAMPPGSR